MRVPLVHARHGTGQRQIVESDLVAVGCVWLDQIAAIVRLRIGHGILLLSFGMSLRRPRSCPGQVPLRLAPCRGRRIDYGMACPVSLRADRGDAAGCMPLACWKQGACGIATLDLARAPNNTFF